MQGEHMKSIKQAIKDFDLDHWARSLKVNSIKTNVSKPTSFTIVTLNKQTYLQKKSLKVFHESKLIS